MNGKGYGMPSSHAQFLTFFSLSLTLFLLLRHNPPSPHASYPTTNVHTPLLHRIAISFASVTLAFFVAASRVYLNYHTPRQVLVGCAAGALSAIAWYIVTEWARRSGLLQWILELGICRTLRLRDLLIEEDLVEAGWREWEIRTKKRGIQAGRIGPSAKKSS